MKKYFFTFIGQYRYKTMKTLKAILIGTLFIVISMAGKAQDTDSTATTTTTTTATTMVQFYNNTSEDVLVAIAFYDKESDGWSSKGWWTVPSYKQFNLDLGNYTGRIYIHGEQSGLMGSSWGKGYSFCVDKDKGFLIHNADKADCFLHKPDFSEHKVATGISKWEFNP